MSIRVAIRHQTAYRFDRAVKIFPHIIRLRPAPHTRSRVLSYSLSIGPEEHFINWQQDPFGNWLARLVFPEKSRELLVDVEVILDMTVINPFDFFVEEFAEKYPFTYPKELAKQLAPYLEIAEDGKLLTAWLAKVDRSPQTINDFLVALNQRVERDIDYEVRMEVGVQTCEQTLQLKRGSCRDSAWLLVQILRHLGLAARFVSGYLVQLTSDIKPLDGPGGPDADFTDLHAWCEVYLPGAGWIGLDATSGLFAGEGHIPLACTPSPSSAAPIDGSTGKCEVEFSFSNTVERVHEDPRVTLPYTEEQWQYISALGKSVDAQLVAADVRLTMGGEPTFISADNMDAAQWNTEALGEEKSRLARRLLDKLHQRYAPNGVLHFGQGKWYPGEPIPRWALGCFWRTDGAPLWKNPKLLADPQLKGKSSVGSAGNLLVLVGRVLGLKVSPQPGFEDALHYLWKEQNLPDDVDLSKVDMKSSMERKRIARVLAADVNAPVGYVMPLKHDGRWRSGHWHFRRDRLTLLPGDSPMGFRLPLESLLDKYAEERHFHAERDTFEARSELPVTGERRARIPEVGQSGDADDIYSALCAEVRNGNIHLFLPPLTHLEHWVELVQAIERAATELKLPVILEGYEPPHDPRLKRLHITPDPGVIEVNIHPSHNWDEQVAITESLYQDAFECRLSAEKFMLDGRHTGTGGGNHITLGGPTPADSPFLRRPDLLRSFVTYWQHHPALSYLFSGMFIGPTSQAPRVDEGRDEALYELSVAFQEMPDGEVPQPWLVDRLFRNLLTDITGNTHRSEFCIDKLYAPGTAAGRQGLVEFRGFEMPPHARMSLVQSLLLKSLMLRFWHKPYVHEPVRWGTELHDRFMLPHYIWSDMRDVVEDLNRHDLPFDLAWLAPFEEFRFPHYGEVQIDDINLSLRWAIEPWHVLGEEVSSFGTSRYVDSSVERLQVLVKGMTHGRHVVSCNGRRLPLRSTGRHGEYVAAVRYRAWQPPSCLHPTIGIHAPLTFDVIDTWNGRAIGGCVYHVHHPGGRSYDSLPVNAFEAEARRVNRFDTGGHTQGPLMPPPAFDALREFIPAGNMPRPMAPPPEEPAHEYPHTLDLRKARV